MLFQLQYAVMLLAYNNLINLKFGLYEAKNETWNLEIPVRLLGRNFQNVPSLQIRPLICTHATLTRPNIISIHVIVYISVFILKPIH